MRVVFSCVCVRSRRYLTIWKVVDESRPVDISSCTWGSFASTTLAHCFPPKYLELVQRSCCFKIELARLSCSIPGCHSLPSAWLSYTELLWKLTMNMTRFGPTILQHTHISKTAATVFPRRETAQSRARRSSWLRALMSRKLTFHLQKRKTGALQDCVDDGTNLQCSKLALDMR